ncbi:MAG: hypothetical protein C4560_13365 [Nitrospiraceae bacterium]|nr:MAG: hypothetical protein C4560_13365 [Nitrospiraceae bacterium]
MGLIFYLSSNTFCLPKLPSNSDKLIHILVYIPLAFLLYISLDRSGVKRYVFGIAILLTGIYGFTDEFHQSFVAGRDASLYDSLADFTGALLGSLAGSFFKT